RRCRRARSPSSSPSATASTSQRRPRRPWSRLCSPWSRSRRSSPGSGSDRDCHALSDMTSPFPAHPRPPMTPPAPKVTRREDSPPPPFLIDSIDLKVDLGKAATDVGSRLTIRRNPEAATQPADLVLDGKKLELVSVLLDGKPAAHEVGPESLT